MYRKLKAIFHEYPRTFWLLVLSSFVDRFGAALICPLFALYITRKFNVGMTQVGELFMLFAVSSFAGGIVGGLLADRFGRKRLVIFGLVSTALCSLVMGVVGKLTTFFAVAVLSGVFTDSGGPARQALVADLLPEEQRAQGYSIIRTAVGISVAIAPAIGGFFAVRSYFVLFAGDAFFSFLAAVLLLFYLPETGSVRVRNTPRVTGMISFRSYSTVLRDRRFMLFCAACLLATSVGVNLYTTLGVYLRNVHGLPESGYGMLLSLNAGLIVLFQVWVVRRTAGVGQLRMMAFGTLLCSVGFLLYAFVSTFSWFLVAVVIVTSGEMIIMPLIQAVAVELASEEMRGRYLAANGIACGIPYAVGPYLAGLLMDRADPRWLWYGTGVIGLVAAALFMRLQRLQLSAGASVAVLAVDEA